MKKRLIYALCCPVTEEVHYIGKSTQGLTRPKQHMIKSHSEKVKLWVEELKSWGYSPNIKVLKYADDSEDLDVLEDYFVKKAMSEGCFLLNNSLVTPVMIAPTLLVQPEDSIYDISEIANVVRARRKAVGLTQEELANRSGVALTVVRKIEQNKINITMDGLLTILAMFGLKLTVK